MSQAKFDRHWLKQMMYGSTYGGVFKPGIINRQRKVKPLFWEQHAKLDYKKFELAMAKAISNTKER